MLRFLFILVLSVSLFGCHQDSDHTYAYYMQHPFELKKEIEVCQSGAQLQPATDKKCEVVMSAATNMSSLVSEQQDDPEKFGQRVLDAQFAAKQANAAVQQANEKLAILKKNQASVDELKLAQEALQKSQAHDEEQAYEVRVLLAVLGLGSPE